MDIMNNILHGWLGLFIHPLFYLFLLLALWMGVRRVRRERHDFRVRVFGVADEFKAMIGPGLLMGVFASMVTIAVGLVLTPGMLVLVAGCYVLVMLTFQLRLLTPVFVVGIAVLTAYGMPAFQVGVPLLDRWISDIQQTSLAAASLLLGILLIVEGVLVLIWGHQHTTPRVLQGLRGKYIGAHEARKFWLVPVCLLLPMSDGAIPALDMWPFTVSIGGSFSLWLVPFGFGFYRRITDAIPRRVVARRAVGSFYLGGLVILIAAFGLYTDMAIWAPTAAGLAIGLRMLFMIMASFKQKKDKTTHFRQRNDGLTVLGILPASSADKMGVQIGERIQKVNGERIYTEDDFYTALQQHGAYCRMEVVDVAGEARFVQGALYEGGHHELGLLFVHAPKAAL